MRVIPFARRWLTTGVLGIAVAQGGLAQEPPKPAPAAKPAPGKPVTVEPPPGTILRDGELPIDLGSALRLAGAENPELLLARERVTEAVAIRQLAAAQLLPNINFGSNYDQHRGVLQQSNGNILPVHRDALYYGLGASAIAAGTVGIPGINYNLNVGEVWFGRLQARQLVAAREFAAQAVRNDVLLRVCLAYLELLRAYGRLAIAGKNRDEAAEVTRVTAAFAQTGQGRKADADRAAVELKRRDADLVQAEADILTATARLAQLLNLDPSTRLKPIDGWAVPTPVVPPPTPLPDLIAIALMERPELAARRAEIQGALYALSEARLLPFSPNVILGFSAGGFGGGSDLVSAPEGFIAGNGQRITGPRFGNFDGRTDFDVVMFWTLRNLGVGNVAMIRGAESVVRQSRLRELEVLNRVRAEVAEAHARAFARFAQIDTAEKAVRSSQEAYREDLTRTRGAEGLPIEVVDSLRLLGQSRYEYLDAVIDYNRAQFQLYVALGRPPADVLARPVPADLVPPPTPVGVPLPGLSPPPGSVAPGPRLVAPARLPEFRAPNRP
jgi:outer membrane protein TolC